MNVDEVAREEEGGPGSMQNVLGTDQCAPDDEEMVDAERDLAEDAQWKKIQQNTFTRWANEHLKTVFKNVGNLETDLSDGLRLIGLIEVLSGKQLPKHNKRPNFRSQKLENVSVALEFLEKDSSDIVDCKLKLILGLIWTLILHYSISMPVWEGEEDYPQQQGDKGPTPKQRLLHWVQSKIPDLPINNFTSDWNDGRAVGALVDAVAPGLCPDWPDWNPKDALQNASEAMGLADDWLNVRQLIRPEELINPNIDEQSMMTYLSQYPSAKLTIGAPIRQRTNPNSDAPPRVRAYGPGIEPTGQLVGGAANFTVETFSAGKGDVTVIVDGPRGEKLPVDIKFNNDRNLTYSISYTPKSEGPHTVSISFAGKPIPKSPFSVLVEGHAGDASKVTASGPGLEPEGVVVGRPTYFDVFTKDAGKGVPEVVILDPSGAKNTVPVKLRQLSQDVWRCEYASSVVGVHSVNVFFAGQSIPKNPFGVSVAPVCDAKKVRASGRGLQPKGVRVKDDADFKIYTEGAGEGTVDVRIIGPGGLNEPITIRKTSGSVYEAVYHPKKEGRYVIMITYGGQEVTRSPFEVNVGPYKESAIKAYGPGLSGGVVGYPALFTVETNGETGALGFSIEGPSQAKIDCHDNGDGSADVRYLPTVPGEYAVHILCDDEDIPKSPYIAHIMPKGNDFQPELVKCHGPGLEPTGCSTNKPAEFTVDTRLGGSAPLEVTVMDAKYNPVEVKVRETSEGVYSCSYVPKRGAKHTVQVNYGGVPVQDSPYRVFVSQPTNPSKVQVFGPGVEKGVSSTKSTHFNVDAREAGPGDLQVTIADELGHQVPYELSDNGDGSYSVDYAPPTPGNYKVSVKYAGQEVPSSPFRVPVQPHVDVSKVKVDGLEPIAPINSLQQFKVITKGAGKADISVSITTPSGTKVQAHVIPSADGFLVNFTPTHLGEYLLSISFGGEPVRGTPHRLMCTHESDAGRVIAHGIGLKSGMVNHPAEFTIDTRGAGQGGLGVTVEGPCEAAINCRDNGDGTCSVAYLPTEMGDYSINITFNDEHIPGSPFQALISPEADLNNIRVSGNGIMPHGVFADSPTDFVVDTRTLSSTNPRGKVTCSITNPSGAKTDNYITPMSDGTYRISYTPFEEGTHLIDILYDGVPIPGSPFAVNVRRGCDPNKVKAFGPGLERGVVKKPNIFTIETKGAGTGGLGLAIEGPSEAKMTCKDNRDGSCTVEYVPTEPGDYDISIKFADKDIPGSPFKVPVDYTVDTTNVRAYGPGLDPKNVREGIPQTFKIDASKAGHAPLSVDIVGSKEKPEIRDNGDGTYDVTYKPPKEGTPIVATVKWNGKDIPNTPVHMNVRPKVEPGKVKVFGKGVSSTGIPASIPVDFTVDTTEAGFGDLEVQVLGPDNYPRKVKITDNNGDGTFKASYTPDDCGRYKVNVKYGGKEIPHSPFPVQSYATGHADKCKITEGLHQALNIGEEYCITVNAKNAGSGAVTCRIRSTSGSDVDIEVDDNHDGTFSIYYMVKDIGEYTLSIKFGGQPVPDGFYTFTADTDGFVKKERVERYNATPHATNLTQQTTTTTTTQRSTTTTTTTYRPVELHNIPLPTTGGHVVAEIKMPSGTVDKPMIEDNRDGTVSIRYDPREEGLHELHVKYNGEHVQGSPFKFHVDTISSGFVTAYGSGLTHGVSGEPCNFTISTKGAGAGGLSLAVEGPSKAEISCHDNKDGTVSVSYLPTAPGEYKISVKFGDKNIKGSPFTAKITGEGRKRNQISVGSCSEVTFPGKVTDADLRALNASICAPSGLEEPCFLKRLPSGNIGISFTPREIGEHLVSVKRMGTHIANSPFKIQVGEREVGDAKKVKTSGTALKEGSTHADNTFNVDTRNAGYGGLSLSIEGPSKAEIKCQDKDDGTLDISYTPTEPGYYIVNLKFADHHVEGSPFTVKVSGEGSNRQRERIQRQREAVPLTEVGSECRLTFKMPGILPLDLSATVTSPGGVTEDAAINEVEDGLYAVHFVPKELGVHTVSVRYKDMHIPGSPFQFTVGALRDGGAHRVHAGGPGLERGEQGQPCEFNIWTREAGAGSLAISVEGPSKAEIDFKDRKDGSCYVSYVVTEPGEYRVGIKFNDQHIPDSPYKVYISPSVADARKVEVFQLIGGAVQPGKPAQFMVRKNGATGNLDAKLISPSGVEDDCFIAWVEDDVYSIRYVPKENGIHNIHVKFNGVHITGSPFRVKVGKDDADPAAVNAHGKGLMDVKTGQKTDFIVDTCNAGAGHLAVTIDGPSKVSMDCTEVEEGYKVRYTPLVPGDYYISVKYNGYHIVGSPFKVICSGDDLAERGAQETSSVVVETVQKVSKYHSKGPVLPLFKSDASKVTCKGMGLKKAFMQKQNQFTINATDAGNNIVYVGVYGPKGPCEEVFIKHLGHNNYQVNYTVRDRGEYLIICKWGDEHIPGSPFKVDV
ncbi:filamin-A isoform X3 [Folsomia candida]|uniref:filamin-A isoform X3 n=1 Tax=Folsomia candida TaxID=158441 RepID=UPI001604B6E8|nr:filamin-A isoform X3 [Folsomia candida]